MVGLALAYLSARNSVCLPFLLALIYCRNWYVVGLALTYFFVYVVRQGVTSWFVFYLLQVRMQQQPGARCDAAGRIVQCAHSRLCPANQMRNQLFISPLHGLCCPPLLSLQVKGVADAGAASLRVSGLELGGLFGSLLAGKLSDMLINNSKGGGGNVGKRVQVGRDAAAAAEIAAAHGAGREEQRIGVCVGVHCSVALASRLR